jgi:WD40 repeat protein
MTMPVFAGSIEPAVFGDPELRADGDIAALAFDSAGILRSVEEPGTLRSWDIASGRQINHEPLSDLETVWAFHPAGRLVAAASNDLSIWDAATGRLIQAWAQPSWVSAVAFDHGASLIATGHDDGLVCIWNAAAGAVIRNIRPHSEAVSALAFSPDGQLIAAACEDKTIAIAAVGSGEVVRRLEGHLDRIPALLWGKDGSWLLSAGWDGTARVWNPRTGQMVAVLNAHEGQVLALASDASGELAASADSSGKVCMWQTTGWQRTQVFLVSDAEVRCLAIHGEGANQLLACGGADRLLHIWELGRGQPISGHAAMPQAYASAALTDDGSRLVANGPGRGCRVWEVASRQTALSLSPNEAIDAVAISADGQWIAGACDRLVRLWHGATGKPHATLPNHDEPITRLAFSPDGALLAAASTQGMSVWLWEVEPAKPILLIPDALDGCAIQGLTFHPQGRLLAVGGIDWMATGGSDGTISIWDLNDRCEVATFGGGTSCLTFDRQGRRLAAANLDHTIQIWDVVSQEILLEVGGHDGTVNSLAFSADGKQLASGGDDNTLRIWDTTCGAQILARELSTQVKVVCFSPDCRKVYTANGNGTCCEFNIA